MEKRDKQKKIATAAAVMVAVILFVLWCVAKEGLRQNAVLQPASEVTPGTEAVEGGEIYVHITGEIKNPGVIKLPAGARLIDAIELLGGLTPEADSESINLAAVLEDEDKIHIYKAGDKGDAQVTEAEPGTVAASGKININTASVEELKKLSGIGDVLAQNIIDYREKNGRFRSQEELMEVDRIGEKLFEKIKDHIVI